MTRGVERRPGGILVQVSLCLTVLLGVAAVALEGGLLFDNRRKLQVAADAAALSAADDLYNNYLSNNGVDAKGTAKTSALKAAALHGYMNDGVTSIVTANIPPASGIAVGKAGYAEVILQYNQPRAISGIFGSGDIPVRARAVARGLWTPLDSAILLLDPRVTGALTTSGSVTTNVVGGPVVVDSIATQAVIAGSSGTLTAPQFDITGSISGGTISGTINTGVTATPDPFTYLYLPIPSLPIPATLPLRSSVPLQVTTTTTLNPGLYKGGININVPANATVTLLPGIYYLQGLADGGGGGFAYAGQGNLVANGVMLYNVPFNSQPVNNGEVINIAGQGTVAMTPMVSGLFQGFSIFQTPYSTLPVTITGNGNMNITGTIYAAHGELKIQGNGATNVIGSQYVAYRLTLSGTGNVSIRRDIGLTARTRVIGLVE